MEPVAPELPPLAGGLLAGATEGPPPPVDAAGDDGELDDPDEHAARTADAAARPPTPAIPPRTRRLVTRGLPGEGIPDAFGASGFAMVSSSGPKSPRGRFCAYEQTATGSNELSAASPA